MHPLRRPLLLATALVSLWVWSCADYESAQEDVFGTPPPPRDEELDEPGRTSSGSSSSGNGSGDAAPLPACPALRTFPLDAAFGTLRTAGGEMLVTADGTKLSVDARTSVAYERELVVRADCPLELSLDTTGFSTTNGHFLDLIWIDYQTATRFGTIEIGGYSPTYEDTDDSFALTRSSCDQSGCNSEYAEDVDVSGAAVTLRVPLAGAGVPSLKVGGVPHTDPKLLLPADPITKLTLYVGQRSIDSVEGTITYRSVGLNAPSP